MANTPMKRSFSSEEDSSLSDPGSVHEEEKTIPFLRRLSDMLLENGDVISFAPGHNLHGTRVLGRIIVHDRIQMESKVLPRYFNHSSFASLRRQLNYFSFVRLGKGRQRESTYINDHVVVLDDILHLKRRAACSNSTTQSDNTASKAKDESRSDIASKMFPSESLKAMKKEQNKSSERQRSPKRRRPAGKQKIAFQIPSQSVHNDDKNFVSEDEHSDVKQYIALDLTKPEQRADDDVLEGCNALLELASLAWN